MAVGPGRDAPAASEDAMAARGEEGEGELAESGAAKRQWALLLLPLAMLQVVSGSESVWRK